MSEDSSQLRKKAAVDPTVLLKYLNTDSLTINISTKPQWFKEHQGRTGGNGIGWLQKEDWRGSPLRREVLADTINHLLSHSLTPSQVNTKSESPITWLTPIASSW